MAARMTMTTVNRYPHGTFDMANEPTCWTGLNQNYGPNDSVQGCYSNPSEALIQAFIDAGVYVDTAQPWVVVFEGTYAAVDSVGARVKCTRPGDEYDLAAYDVNPSKPVQIRYIQRFDIVNEAGERFMKCHGDKPIKGEKVIPVWRTSSKEFASVFVAQKYANTIAKDRKAYVM